MGQETSIPTGHVSAHLHGLKSMLTEQDSIHVAKHPITIRRSRWVIVDDGGSLCRLYSEA